MEYYGRGVWLKVTQVVWVWSWACNKVVCLAAGECRFFVLVMSRQTGVVPDYNDSSS